ncbi:MAG TPA: amidohydrolase family protein [Candidatus Acidoferrales bacterium]|nr:amidohydrolase family protein [Candidatus Acidoferrales bacterium]
MRNRTPVLALAALAALVAVAVAPAQAPHSTYAIRGAKIFTLAGPPIEDGAIVIRDGKIAAVGRAVSAPSGAQVIDAKGLQVYPGIFDSITQTGLEEVGAVSATVDTVELGPFNPDIVAADGVHPESAYFAVNRAAGITHVLTVPGMGGGAGLIGGQVSAINMAGWDLAEMLVNKSVAMELSWPTLGTARFNFATFSVTQRPYAEVRREYENRVNELADWIERARHYAQAERQAPGSFTADLKLAALAPVAEGKQPLLVFAERARDIRNAVEFCAQHKLRMVLAGGEEAYQVVDLLKQNHVPVVFGSTLESPPNGDDPYDLLRAEPGRLAAAGVEVALASFNTSRSRRLPQFAGVAAAYGMPWEQAIIAITITPAQIFGLDKQLGTVETGKMANLIVTTGDPLELTTQIRYLFVDGRETSLDNKQLDLYKIYEGRH